MICEQPERNRGMSAVSRIQQEMEWDGNTWCTFWGRLLLTYETTTHLPFSLFSLLPFFFLFLLSCCLLFSPSLTNCTQPDIVDRIKQLFEDIPCMLCRLLCRKSCVNFKKAFQKSSVIVSKSSNINRVVSQYVHITTYADSMQANLHIRASTDPQHSSHIKNLVDDQFYTRGRMEVSFTERGESQKGGKEEGAKSKCCAFLQP